MEKKRRERINNCLNQLKMFLMDATKKDVSNKELKQDSPTVFKTFKHKKRNFPLRMILTRAVSAF